MRYLWKVSRVYRRQGSVSNTRRALPLVLVGLDRLVLRDLLLASRARGLLYRNAGLLGSGCDTQSSIHATRG